MLNTVKNNKKVIIMGAGPAGLSAAYELVKKSDIKPVVIEMAGKVGGISKTINYNGWKFDIGPHRFFSKNDYINSIWNELLPCQKNESLHDINLLNSKETSLLKDRFTRIYYENKLFDYPIKLNINNLAKLGFLRVLKIIIDYLFIKIKPIKKEVTLEDFFINRFGKTLYYTFFKDYTEKVWGVKCSEIPKSWGAQRVKKLSISKLITEALKNLFIPKRESSETSLVNKFIYPKFGSGQMYEKMAQVIKEGGGEIITNEEIVYVDIKNKIVKKIKTKNKTTGLNKIYEGDYFLSSLAIKDLIKISSDVSKEVKEIAKNLAYRDFISVTFIYNKLKLKNKSKVQTKYNLIPDHWVYVQNNKVKMARIDIFNNFSPWLLKNKSKVLIAAEYFCNENDKIWSLSDQKIIEMAKKEFSYLKIADEKEVIDAYVHRQKKAYPAYFGSYKHFDKIKIYLNSISNLYLIGRNGQHRYNNMDHSMLTGIKAAEDIIYNKNDKSSIWEVNTEEKYHEKK